MKRVTRILLTLFVVPMLAVPASAVEESLQALSNPDGGTRLKAAETLAETRDAKLLDALLPMLSDANQDTGLAALIAAESLIQLAAADAVQRPVASAALLAYAADSDQDLERRRWALRQLGFTAHAPQVDELAALLEDADVAEMALYALELVPGESTDAALADALPNADDGVKAGILAALGRRGAAQYTSLVHEHVSHTDPNVRLSAIDALGRLPTGQAEHTLRTILGWRDFPAEHNAAGRAYGNLADLLAQSGNRANTRLAESMYRQMYDENPHSWVRCAGLRGLASLQGSRALGLLLEALESSDADVRGAAVDALVTLPGTGVTRAVGSLDGPPAVVMSRLSALGRRGDRDAARYVVPALADQQEAVRVAALRALGMLRDDHGVQATIALLDSDSESERGIAEETLNRIPGARADAALLAAQQIATGTRQQALLRLLSLRDLPQAREILIEASTNDDEAVRLAAITGLGNIEGEGVIDALLSRMSKGGEDEQAAAHAALLRQPQDQLLEPLKATAASGPADTRAGAIRVLGQTNDASLLPLYVKAANDPNEAVSLAALQAMIPLQDPSTADLLLEKMQSGSPREKVLATQAYLDMADAQGEGSLEMYLKIIDQASEDGQIIRALDGLARIKNPAGADAVLELIQTGSPQVRAKAGWAMVPIAEAVAVAGEHQRGLDLSLAAVRASDDAGMIRIAADRMKLLQHEFDPRRDAGFLSDFQLLGPLPGRTPWLEDDAIDPTAPPDVNQPVRLNGANLAWQAYTVTDPAGEISFPTIYGNLEDTGVYAYTTVTSSEARDVTLKVGSDDDVYVWLNGALIHRWNGNRGVTIDEEQISARLRAGKNHLLFKVLQGESAWGLAARFGDAQGRTIILDAP